MKKSTTSRRDTFIDAARTVIALLLLALLAGLDRLA